jgi:hypothetical protein
MSARLVMIELDPARAVLQDYNELITHTSRNKTQ